MKCESCPHQLECHNESNKMQSAMKDIETGQDRGFSQLAYEGAARLRKLIDERHKKIFTGGNL